MTRLIWLGEWERKELDFFVPSLLPAETLWKFLVSAQDSTIDILSFLLLTYRKCLTLVFHFL